MSTPLHKLLSIGAIICASMHMGCAPKPYLAQPEVQYNLQAIYNTFQNNNSIDSFLAPYKVSSDSLMKIIVGKSTIPLTKAQPESTMGNFVADAQLEFAKRKDPQVKASVINYGGIRINYLAPGDITLGNLFEIMPFDNTLVIAEVPGTVVKQMCNLIAEKKGWPIAGIKMTINAAGKADSILIDDKPINDHIIYKIAISDYLANGGDNCEFFKSCKRNYYNVFVRDMMHEYLKQQQTITPQLDQRIVYE